MLRNVGHLLSERARLSPDMEAIVDLGNNERYTYAQLDARVNDLAHRIYAHGMRKGERVGILMTNSAAYMEAYYALAKLGVIAVLLNWRLTPAEQNYILSDSGTSAVLYTPDLAEHVQALKPDNLEIKQWLVADQEEGSLWRDLGLEKRFDALPAQAEPDDALYIMYTSGTTGKPKGAVMTHGASIAWHMATLATRDNRYGERCYTVAPLFHIGGIAAVKSAVHAGLTNVIDRGFDPDRIWRVLADEKINVTFLVPAMLNFMLKSPHAWKYDHSELRAILCGAAPVPVSLIEAFGAQGIEIHQIYGATECHGGICLMTPEHALSKAGSTGKAYYGLEVRVVDDRGHDVKPGQPGEVITRGEHIMQGYWNRPEETDKAIRDGWLYLGDIAEVDEDGFIYIKDRSKDMIISGGENIYPAELENVILMHPEIKEVAVIGQPSARWGESPCAILVLKDGAAHRKNEIVEELQDLCREKLAKFKRPKAYEFIDVIPRNPTGKSLKRILRDQFPGPAPI